ncbi:42468_t:CDS:1 [Gigaspora margarita]|uniref:42468_t:CDS:1 n=1 Tax=Gigaspora margarita TaxID=4874 RepID=A0ABN7W9T3_GIGMA|nr:42468_t:CDS:1 [Gigaspora margarita]
MANKFHIGSKRVYEIWDNKKRLQQGAILSQSILDKNFKTNKSEQNLEAVPEVPSTSTPTMKIPKKNGQKKKVSLELEIRQEKNENKDNVISNNLPDVSQKKRLESLLENLVNYGKKLKSSVSTFDIFSI